VSAGDSSEAYGDFTYTSRYLTFGLVAIALVAACFVVGGVRAGLDALREHARPGVVGPLALACAVVLALCCVYCLLIRRNALLRISEDGLHYRNWLGRTTFLRWEEIVALRMGSWLAHDTSWYVRYLPEPDGEERWLCLPALLYLRGDAWALQDTIRAKAHLTRKVWWFGRGLGWERE